MAVSKKKKVAAPKKTTSKLGSKLGSKSGLKAGSKAKLKVKAKVKTPLKSASKPKPKVQLKAKAKVQAKPKAQLKPKSNLKIKAQAKVVKAAPKKATSNASKSTAKQKSATADYAQVFSPLDDRILVDVLPPETKTAGGLFIPDSAQNQQSRGVVVAVGPGRRNKKSQIRPMDVQMGDKIIYAQYAGTTIEVLGKEVLILREDEVLAIVNK